MTELIRQRYGKDCFLCCLAMALAMPYDILLAKIGPELVERVKERGLYGTDVDEALSRLGVDEDHDIKRLFLLPEYGTVPFIKNLLWGRRALIQVRSKNYADEMHIVYWDGARLFDPSPLRTWRWDEIEPVYLYLLRDAPAS